MEDRIVPLIEHPQLVPAVVDWILREWPGPGKDAASVERRLCGDRKPLEWPSALVALADGEPAGVVSLTHYEPGAPKGRPHWIDAVYVAPARRRAGLATRLIAAAEAQAARLGASHLHALTEIPRLYLKSGWTIVEEPGPAAPRDFVMGKALPPAS